MPMKMVSMYGILFVTSTVTNYYDACSLSIDGMVWYTLVRANL